MEIQLNVNINAPELVESINNLAGALSIKASNTIAPQNQQTEKVTEEPPKPHRTRKTKPVEKKEPPVEEPTEESVTEKVTEEPEKDLRAKLKNLAVEKARNGKSKEVKEIIDSTGSTKLSEIPDDKLPEVLKKIGAL